MPVTQADFEPYSIVNRKVAIRLTAATGCFFGFVGDSEYIRRGRKEPDVDELHLWVSPFIRFECLGQFVPADFGQPLVGKENPVIAGSRSNETRKFEFRNPRRIGMIYPAIEGVLWIVSETGSCALSHRGRDVLAATALLERK
ncbi:MAG: hypothetical protein QOG91_346 [Candidatus Parcubacteria bacterium]|nr:hypothetical protein [Candidatus Parcubacteria bacterium]